MPDNTNATHIANNPTNWMPNNVPGGDLPFEQLFTNEGASLEPTQAQTVEQPAVAQPAPKEPFLRTSTGSVYETIEDARKGTEEKDTLIQQMRARLAGIEGVDPITKKPSGSQDQPPNYFRDRKRFMRDAATAVQKQDEEAYLGVHEKLLADYLAPVAPVLQNWARSHAVEEVSQEFKDFREFRSGNDYRRVLDANPVLKNGIEGAEANLNFSEQLPGLYRLAYNTYLAGRIPQMLQSAQQAAQPAPAAARPTSTSSSPAPTDPISQADARRAMYTSEDRAELIKRLKYLEDIPFAGRI